MASRAVEIPRRTRNLDSASRLVVVSSVMSLEGTAEQGIVEAGLWFLR